MAEPVIYCPIHPDVAERLRQPGGWMFTGGFRVTLGEDNVLGIEMVHDCFVMQCTHNGPDKYGSDAQQFDGSEGA